MSKKKEVKFRHRLIIALARIILIPILKKKYNYQFTKYKDLKNKGPFLILGNHTIAIDPILMGLSFPQHNYYIATEQIFNLGFLSKLLVWAVNPIKKSKSVSDMSTIRKAKTIVNQGGSIGVYPEGNLTYTGDTAAIAKPTIKLIRLLKIPVIIFIAEGLYFSNPRWAINNKKGMSKGYIKRIIEPEEYNQLDDEKLYELISSLLYVDAYNPTQIPKMPYYGKDIALGLERLVFIDLKTNRPFVTYSESDQLLSHDSDFKLRYDNYGYLHDQDNNIYTLAQIEQKVFNSYLNYLKKTPEKLLCQEMVTVFETSNKRKIRLGEALIKLYKDSLVITLNNQDLTMNFSDITTIAIQGKKKNIIYYQDKTYLITLDQRSAPLKYLLTYQYYQYLQVRGENDEHIDISKFGL